MKSKPMPMENTIYPRFINGEAAQQMFAEQSSFDIEKYPTLTKLKAWVGAYYGVYEYRDNFLNPVIVDKVKLVHMEVRMAGPSGLMVSMVTGNVTEIACIPKQLSGFSLGLSFAQRSYFEKTIKEFAPDDIMCGLASMIQAHHRQRPDHKSERVQFIDLWGNLKGRFSDMDSFVKETERLRSLVSLV